MGWSVNNAKHAATNQDLSGKSIKGDQKKRYNTFLGRHEIDNSDLTINQRGKGNQIKLNESDTNNITAKQVSTSAYGRNIFDVNGDDNTIDLTHKGGRSRVRTTGDGTHLDLDSTEAKNTTNVFKGNDFLSSFLSLSETGPNNLLVQGDAFNIGNITGGEDVDQFIFDGNGKIDSIETHEGNDEVTFTGDGQTTADVDLGKGDDVVRANGLKGKVEGGAGTDTARFRTTKGNNKVQISNVENIEIDGVDLGANFDLATATKADLPSGMSFETDSDGNRAIKIGDSTYNLDDTDSNITIGGKTQLASEWFTQFGSTAAPVTTDTIDGTVGDDTLDARNGDFTVNADHGDDTIFVDGDSSGIVHGGRGNDTLTSEVKLGDYDNIVYDETDDKFTLTKDGNKLVVSGDVENFDFDGQALTKQELEDHAKNLNILNSLALVEGNAHDETITKNGTDLMGKLIDGKDGNDTLKTDVKLVDLANITEVDINGVKGFELTDANGDISRVVNIENFDFDGQVVSAADLINEFKNPTPILTAVDGDAGNNTFGNGAGNGNYRGSNFFGNLYDGKAGSDSLWTDHRVADLTFSLVDINGTEGIEIADANGNISRVLNMEHFNFGGVYQSYAQLKARV